MWLGLDDYNVWNSPADYSIGSFSQYFTFN